MKSSSMRLHLRNSLVRGSQILMLYFYRILSYRMWRKAFLLFFDRVIDIYVFMHSHFRKEKYRDWFFYIQNNMPKVYTGKKERSFHQRIFFRYLRNWFSFQQSMNIIIEHYNFMTKHFSFEHMKVLSSEQLIIIASLIGKTGRRYEIMFRMEPSQEGEIIIGFLDCFTHTYLASIGGSFGKNNEGNVIFWLGVLQGCKNSFGKARISEVTSDLYSLRPKQAVFNALCSLCEWMGVTTIYATSNKNHVFTRRRYDWFSRDRMKADYDAFWKEYTNIVTEKGDYVLTLPLRRRKPIDVRAKRRKLWKQRYEALDIMSQDIVQNLNDFTTGKPMVTDFVN